MQVVVFTIAVLGFNLAIVKYDGKPLACADNGQVGVCIDATGEVISEYDCGSKGCSKF